MPGIFDRQPSLMADVLSRQHATARRQPNALASVLQGLGMEVSNKAQLGIGGALSDVLAHGPGLLREGAGMATDWARNNPGDALALAVSPIPFFGNIAGVANDIRHYISDPESRNWLNYGLTALGALPVGSAAKTAVGTALTKAVKPAQDDIAKLIGKRAFAAGTHAKIVGAERIGKDSLDVLLEAADGSRFKAVSGFVSPIDNLDVKADWGRYVRVSKPEKISINPLRGAQERIEKYAKAAGLEVEDLHGSSSSGSRYLTIVEPLTDAMSDAGQTPRSIKVRISDHQLPPSHGQWSGWADFEVGVHQDANGDWVDALMYAYKKLGVEPPASLKSTLGKREK